MMMRTFRQVCFWLFQPNTRPGAFQTLTKNQFEELLQKRHSWASEFKTQRAYALQGILADHAVVQVFLRAFKVVRDRTATKIPALKEDNSPMFVNLRGKAITSADIGKSFQNCCMRIYPGGLHFTVTGARGLMVMTMEKAVRLKIITRDHRVSLDKITILHLT